MSEGHSLVDRSGTHNQQWSELSQNREEEMMRGRVGRPKMKTQEMEHFGSTFMPDYSGIRKCVYCLTLQLCVFPSKLAAIS